MKITIKQEGKKNHNLRLPTFLLKSKLVFRIIAKTNKEKKEEVMKYYLIAKEIYKALKRYIKKNGHIVLVNVVTSEGVIVKIVV